MRFERTARRPGLALALVVGFSLLVPTLKAEAQGTTAGIVSSASSQGETISCGCKKKELGGVARRASVIKEERSRSAAFLLVDAGDFGSHVATEPWMRTEFQWQMMSDLGYDVVTVGPNEMTEGLVSLKRLLSTAPEIQVVSANITDKNGDLLWPEYTIVERDGVRFGVTGVTDKSYYSFNVTRGKQKSNDFSFRDLRESLTGVVPRLRQESDVVIVLLHTGSGDAKRMIEGVEGIDVVVVGHAPTYKFVPERIGNTILINGGNRGQYLGVLELTLNAEKAIVDYNGESRPLGDVVAIDPEFNALITEFNQKYDALKPKKAEVAEEN